MVRILRILKAGKVNVMLENLVFLGPGAAFFRVQRLPVLEKKAVGCLDFERFGHLKRSPEACRGFLTPCPGTE